MKGSKPGRVFVCGRFAVSSAVYSGLTLMPSGVTQFRAVQIATGRRFLGGFAPGFQGGGVEFGLFLGHGWAWVLGTTEIDADFISFIIIDAKYSSPTYNQLRSILRFAP